MNFHALNALEGQNVAPKLAGNSGLPADQVPLEFDARKT